MERIYLYGASDDCMECEATWGDYESYRGIQIGDVVAHYFYDGDWGVWLEGDIPEDWKVKSIWGNCPYTLRGKPHAGQFIVIDLPNPVQVIELTEEDFD